MARDSNSLTPDKWADAALDAMAAGGPASVAVEPLARELGVTKGSFYHHFSSREELLTAALIRWEERGTAGVLGRVEGESARARLEALFISAMDTAVDPRWGRLLTHLAAHRQDPLIGPVLARVTARRLDWLTETWEATGLDRGEAGRRALLAYTAYLGMVQLSASAPERAPRGDALRAYVHRLVEIFRKHPGRPIGPAHVVPVMKDARSGDQPNPFLPVPKPLRQQASGRNVAPFECGDPDGPGRFDLVGRRPRIRIPDPSGGRPPGIDVQIPFHARERYRTRETGSISPAFDERRTGLQRGRSRRSCPTGSMYPTRPSHRGSSACGRRVRTLPSAKAAESSRSCLK